MIITKVLIETLTEKLITSAAVYSIQEAARILAEALSGI